MKIIILAAGRGTRLKPLTNTVPKPILKIFGESIIKHNLKHIYKYVSDIIIVVKDKRELVEKELGNNYKGVKIKYHIQGDEKGTASALKGIKIEEDFIVLNGDSIFNKDDLHKIIKLKGFGALVKETSSPEKYGIYKQNKEGFANKIYEKPTDYVGNLANLGVYKFSKEILKDIAEIKLSKRGEFEITDAINLFVKKNDFKLLKISGDFIDIGYPWDILTANKSFIEKIKSNEIKGIVEENVTIKGSVILGEGSILKSGTYIEGNICIGKNSSIGPNTYLRGNSIIGDNCKIGNAVEIKNSSIGDNTNVAHLSYIGDSIIGNSVNIGGGFISANLRHDNKNIKVIVKGELIDSGLRKLGCIIGDNTKTGMNTSTYPGRVINNDSFTTPGEIIK